MLKFKPGDLNRIIARQQDLFKWADDEYDAYANHIDIVAWRQKWIWDYLNIKIERDEESQEKPC